MRFIKLTISILLILSLSLCCVYAEEDFPVTVNAKAVLLMDMNTQTVILQKNGDEQLDVTTTVKTMSILLFMEALKGGQLNLDTSVQVGANAASAKGMQAFLEAGDQYSVRELLKCVVMISANDACIALAEHMAGSEEAFVSKMNARAGAWIEKHSLHQLHGDSGGRAVFIGSGFGHHCV
jgi:D-alanyl-D-alanine carboxypeptidase (penicillin-binding protein 5/6)